MYSLLRRFRTHVTLVTRSTSETDLLTGERTPTDHIWSGDVAFVPGAQMPRKDQVDVADAWVLTDQPVQKTTEVHCRGSAFAILKIIDHQTYRALALKAVAPAEVHLILRSHHEFSHEMSGALT